VGDCGQADDEGCALPVGVVVTENFSAMLLDDAVANAQAQASALANLFGGEEGIEDAIRVRNSRTVITERNFDAVPRTWWS